MSDKAKPDIPADWPWHEERDGRPILFPGACCNIEQYERLKRCSDAGDMTEWNEWREANSDEEIVLQGADLHGAHLENADLRWAHLEKADLLQAHLANANLSGTHLENAVLAGAHLENADLSGAHLENAQVAYAHLRNAYLVLAHLENAQVGLAHLENAMLLAAHMEGASFSSASVDGGTLFGLCMIDRDTDFTGVALDSARIDPGLKQLLEYNVRRKRWRDWYSWDLRRPWRPVISGLVWLFWALSDYGLSTTRIFVWFWVFAIAFAATFATWPDCLELTGGGEIRGFGHALYFSVVTMTTLGFGDIHANPASPVGQILLMAQVLLGYVMLGALVTRFAILFSAGGPAASFPPDPDAWWRRLGQIPQAAWRLPPVL